MSFRRGRGMGNGRFSGGRDMDSGRGRGGGSGGGGGGTRDSGPPRGDRLSNHTSDATLASARIFLGNLPTNDARLTKDVLEEHFNPFGRIVGISILKGFGFIQYADEISAEKAIRGAQNMEILGHRMDVKNVKPGKDGMTVPGAVIGGNIGGSNSEPGNFRDRSPIRRREFDMPIRGREPDMPPRGREAEMLMRGGPPHRDLDRGSHDFDGRDQRDWGRDRHDMMDPFAGDPYMDRDRDRHPRDSFHSPLTDHRGNFSGGPGPKPGGMNMANEVEIVVTAKTNALRQYAERIESRIRAQGLAVDVLFPREDIPIRQVLADLSSRGTLFGIVLNPLNQEHGSITLNIFFGQPEEHRNIPVEDAFALLSTSLQRHRQQQGGGGGGRGGGPLGGGDRPLMEQADRNSRGGMQLPAGPEPHPVGIQALINVLQENRPMTVIEYDRLIRYLSDRRDRQMADDGRGGGAAGVGLAGSQPAYLQGGYQSVAMASGGGQDNPMELQQRILSILNSSAGGVGAGIVGAGPAPAPVPAPHLNAQAGGMASSSWNSGVEVPMQQQQRSNDMSAGGHSDGPKPLVDGLLATGPNLMKHYQQGGPAGARQQQQDAPHRPMQPQQQPGGYYGMGKRF